MLLLDARVEFEYTVRECLEFKPPQGECMGKKLYVGNLPFSATDAVLIEIFTQIGPVESARVITDSQSGRSKGFGFVEMANDTDAQSAIQQFHGGEFEGRVLTVAEAKPQAPGGAGGGGKPFAGERRFGGGGQR